MKFQIRAVLLLAVLLVAGTVAGGGRWPWHRRIDKNVESLHLTAHRKTPIELWPAEPGTPAKVEQAKFNDALGLLCGKMPARRLKRYGEMVVAEATAFGVDPFLLGALLYDRSRCWPTTPKRDQQFGRYGLTRIPVTMHARQIKNGEYRYYVRNGGEWILKTLKIDRYPFNKWKASKPESNIYFAAAILKILAQQHQSLDDAFEHEDPHRHYVSHWFYGDKVVSAEPENRVLRARRRLMLYYSGETTTLPAGTYKEASLVSPLDGVPRLVIDYFSNPRGKKGGYGHRGIDIDGASGEPVRAIAAGKVTFAGVDLPGSGQHRILAPDEAAELTRDEIGPGGLYLSINHGNDFGTIYMHLDSYCVNHWDKVEAGQIIGTLGRSGTQKSGPHLHLEFREKTDRVDPARYLDEILINPFKNKKKR
jgi:murein DD-endopeptidase MepM/ murein hydrolase activator NlpD